MVRCALLLAAFAQAGCDVVSLLTPENRGVDGDPAFSGVVTVRFRNLTQTEAVSVQFYLASDSLAAIPVDLFVAGHQVTASIGLAGTGIIQPLHEDAREFPCAATLIMGTTGGEFLDAETGEPRGFGESRWVQEGPVRLCGSVVTFVYSGSHGQFATAVEIER